MKKNLDETVAPLFQQPQDPPKGWLSGARIAQSVASVYEEAQDLSIRLEALQARVTELEEAAAKPRTRRKPKTSPEVDTLDT